MVTYRFRQRAVPGVTPEAVFGELERIRAEDEDGKLAPPAVVREARPREAVLHPAFEWRDRVAAEEYRLWQARQLIRAVIVVADAETPPAPAYVHVEKNDYRPLQVVVERPDLFEQALSDLHAKLAAAERSVRDLERAAKASGSPDRMASIALAVAAFETVREALAVLK